MSGNYILVNTYKPIVCCVASSLVFQERKKIGNESRMECGRVKAKHLLEYPGNLAENPWKNISLCCWPPCILILQNTNELNISVTLILDLGMPTSRAMYFYSYVIFLPQGWDPGNIREFEIMTTICTLFGAFSSAKFPSVGLTAISIAL